MEEYKSKDCYGCLRPLICDFISGSLQFHVASPVGRRYSRLPLIQKKETFILFVEFIPVTFSLTGGITGLRDLLFCDYSSLGAFWISQNSNTCRRESRHPSENKGQTNATQNGL